MEPAHDKEEWSLPDTAHLFPIQNEGDRSLQHTIEVIINLVEGITIRSKNEPLILIFSSLRVFYNMFMPYLF